MTDYNDGNWHIWNGGACPVHPKSIVEAVWHDQLMERAGMSGPRVTALVEAARSLLFAHDHGNGLEGWYNVREKLRAALRAIGGEA